MRCPESSEECRLKHLGLVASIKARIDRMAPLTLKLKPSGLEEIRYRLGIEEPRVLRAKFGRLAQNRAFGTVSSGAGTLV
jgi:hypothetical protein